MKNKILLCIFICLATCANALPSRTASSLKTLRSMAHSSLVRKAAETNDFPKTPENLKISLSDDYKSVTLSWDAVGEVGENGGYVDPSAIVYYIFDAFGSYYDPAIATTKDTSYSFDFSNLEGQDFAAYQVTACTDDYNASLPATSDIVVVGTPDMPPFYESFADGKFSHAWMVDLSSIGDFSQGAICDNGFPGISAADGDNGSYIAMPMTSNAIYGFRSVKIDISKTNNPAFELFYIGTGGEIEMFVVTDGGEKHTVKNIGVSGMTTDSWNPVSVSLDSYRNCRYIQIGILIHGGKDSGNIIALDNIRVLDKGDKELRLVRVESPSEVNAGDSANISVALENTGSEDLENISVDLFAGDYSESTTINKISPYSTCTVNFSIATGALSPDVLPFTVEASAEGVKCTNTGSVAIRFSPLPCPTNVKADVGAGVLSLSWDAPDYESLTKARAITEDFESPAYEAFTIKDFGEWTLIDADGRKTYTFMGDVNNPYRTQPQAFQIFDTKQSGMPEQNFIDAEPWSGERMLVAWSAQGQNDNWLISPRLSGNAQTIRFRAKSFTIAFPESFEVLYSVSGKGVADFVKVAAVGNYPDNNQVEEDWLEYTAELPEGAAYFAIRHTSYDTYALFIDDICFEATGALSTDTKLLGYRPYLDGEAFVQLNKENSIQIPVTPGLHSARISAIYTTGESKASEAVTAEITESGVESVAINTEISMVGNLLTVQAATNTPVTVYSPSGSKIFDGTTSGDGILTTVLPSGIYIVAARDCMVKILVK